MSAALSLFFRSFAIAAAIVLLSKVVRRESDRRTRTTVAKSGWAEAAATTAEIERT